MQQSGILMSTMRPIAACTLGFATTFFYAYLASAQYGTAPSGYYPVNYGGSTFTGVVTDASDDQIIMTQDRKGKVESFTGRPETGCSVPRSDGSSSKMNAPEFPRSTQITVLFYTATKQLGGQKVQENQIVGLTFNEYQGKPVPVEKRRVYSCTESAFKRFKAF
jgi:hypothetical protein